MPRRTVLPLTLSLWRCQWLQVKGNICSYNYFLLKSSSLNNSKSVTVNARLLLRRKKERGNKERQTRKHIEQLYFSLPILSILIRVSSAKPNGVSECIEAISTPHGRSQMPLISSWRLIHSDCERCGWSHRPPHASQDGRHHGGNLRPSSRHSRWENVNGRGLS